MKIYFNTSNPVKKKEIETLFQSDEYDINFLDHNVREILEYDIVEVIKDKAAKAYQLCRVPVVVEHGALLIDYLKDYPGALSKPMWDILEGDICKLIPEGKSRKATALSAVCFCDGKKREVFRGESKGEISTERRGVGGFQWDPIFIPEGQSKTHSEMTQEEKLKYSQAAKAYEELKIFLNKNR